MNHENITTANELPEKKIARNLGIVKGFVLGAAAAFPLPTTSNYEALRQEAFNLMVKKAEELGANSIIAVRFDSSTGVLCYGTAVIAE